MHAQCPPSFSVSSSSKDLRKRLLYDITICMNEYHRVLNVRNFTIISLSFLITVFPLIWIGRQQIPELTLDEEDAGYVEKLIDWQTQKQLRIYVVVLTIAIALVQFARMKRKISVPIFLLGMGLCAIQVISVTRLFQNIQIIMKLEQQLQSPVSQYISDVIAWYQVPLFFDKAGNFTPWGYGIFWFIAAGLVGIWGTVLYDQWKKPDS